MKLKLIVSLVCVYLLSALSSVANAATVEFTFSSIVGGFGTSIPGTSNGQTFDISILADNGTSTTTNQAWATPHFLSATVNIGGGAYVASINNSSASFSASTDVLGQVTGINLTSFCPSCTDTQGSTFVEIYVNGLRQIIFNQFGDADAVDLTTPDNWSVSSVTTIPLPTALPLYGAGLAVLGFMGWRRKGKSGRHDG